MLASPNRRSRPLAALLLGVTAAVGAALVLPSLTTAAGPFTCSGSFSNPGVLSGSHGTGVVVNGVCEVSAGQATVTGNIQVNPGGVLAAAFGRNFRSHSPGSSLQVNGAILALKGSTVILGCTPKQFVCLDDHSGRASLSSHEVVTGGIEANGALAVLVYVSRIEKSIVQRGGGGGVKCARTGVFARFGSTVYSEYRSDTVKGQLRISHVSSCFMAISHVRLGGTLSLTSNRLANPDAIEVTANRIGGNIACFHNSHVWDSEGYNPHKAYPRLPMPNQVGGARLGQCVKATPRGKGQPSGPGPF